MKKKIEIFFPIVLILLLIKIIYYENSFLLNLDEIIISNFFYLFIFIVGINLYISYLFHTIITKIINTDINFIDTLQIFLQGGIINQFIPSTGLMFRYYKFKLVSEITLPEYSFSQFIFSIYSLFTYLLLGAIFGLFAFINLDLNKILILLFSIFTLLLSTYIFRRKIVYLIKINLLKFSYIPIFIKSLSNIKNKIKDNYILFIIILPGFLLLTFLECWAFHQAIEMFGIEIDFLISSIMWISASIISVLAIINFFGFFEIILAFSALALIDKTIGGLMIIAFTIRLLYISAQTILILYTYLYKKIK